MFLIDDILLAPAKGLTAICKKIQDAASQDLHSQEQSALRELSELYQLMEDGGMSDEDFNKREGTLLDQLEAAQGADSTE